MAIEQLSNQLEADSFLLLRVKSATGNILFEDGSFAFPPYELSQFETVPTIEEAKLLAKKIVSSTRGVDIYIIDSTGNQVELYWADGSSTSQA